MAATRKDDRPLVEQMRETLGERLNEIEEEIGPRVAEADEIKTALAALSGVSRTRRASTGRRGRRGHRMAEFLACVEGEPGISVSDVARKMDVAPNYIYRIANKATDDGLVRKEGNGYHRTDKQVDNGASAEATPAAA